MADTPAAHGAAEQARFWDRLARRYAGWKMGDPAGYEATLARVAALLRPGDEVLEIGCGTGTTALRLAVGVRSWLGVDVSAGMIAVARERLAAQPVPTLRFEQADALAPGAAVDALLAFNVLHLVGPLDPALAALHRRLRPGGLLVSKTPCVGEMNPLVTRVLLPLLRALRLAPPLQCLRADALVAAFGRNGFKVEAVEHHATRGGRDIRAFIVARRVGAGAGVGVGVDIEADGRAGRGDGPPPAGVVQGPGA